VVLEPEVLGIDRACRPVEITWSRTGDHPVSAGHSLVNADISVISDDFAPFMAAPGVVAGGVQQ